MTQAPLAGLQHAYAKYDDYFGGVQAPV